MTRDHKALVDVGDRLLLAVPKKGRLYEPTMKLLSGSDLQFSRKNRLDIALCSNIPVAIVFLPASDIAQFVGEGNVDMGITGIDVMRESGMEDKVEVLERLGYGKCRLCVQVPVDSGIKSPKELLGRRVVTSFERLTEEYFDALEASGGEEDGLALKKNKTQVSYISGSVEAACSLGLGDAIVDLVESGETMRAANLTDIATLLQSEAVLISSPRTTHPALVRTILSRIQGVIAASKHLLVKYNISRTNLKEATKITPGNRAPTVSPLEDDGWLAVEAMISRQEQGHILDQLQKCGATDILSLNLKKIMGSKVNHVMESMLKTISNKVGKPFVYKASNSSKRFTGDQMANAPNDMVKQMYKEKITGYMLFMSETIKKMSLQSKQNRFIFEYVADQWRKMSALEKNIYREEAAKINAIRGFDDNKNESKYPTKSIIMTSIDRKDIKDSFQQYIGSKHITAEYPAYHKFLTMKLKEMCQLYPDRPESDLVIEIAEQWKALSPEQRSSYEAKEPQITLNDKQIGKSYPPGFEMFMRIFYPILREHFSEWSHEDTVEKLSIAWKLLNFHQRHGLSTMQKQFEHSSKNVYNNVEGIAYYVFVLTQYPYLYVKYPQLSHDLLLKLLSDLWSKSSAIDRSLFKLDVISRSLFSKIKLFTFNDSMMIPRGNNFMLINDLLHLDQHQPSTGEVEKYKRLHKILFPHSNCPDKSSREYNDYLEKLLKKTAISSYSAFQNHQSNQEQLIATVGQGAIEWKKLNEKEKEKYSKNKKQDFQKLQIKLRESFCKWLSDLLVKECMCRERIEVDEALEKEYKRTWTKVDIVEKQKWREKYGLKLAVHKYTEKLRLEAETNKLIAEARANWIVMDGKERIKIMDRIVYVILKENVGDVKFPQEFMDIKRDFSLKQEASLICKSPYSIFMQRRVLEECEQYKQYSEFLTGKLKDLPNADEMGDIFRFGWSVEMAFKRAHDEWNSCN